MIKRRRFPKVFFGWWTVLAGAILSFWGHGYSAGAFTAMLKPIASELGLSRAAASLPASVSRFEGGLEAPLSGWLTDRYGPRWPILLGLFLFSLGLILMNFVNSLWAFLVAWGVLLGTGVNIALSVPLDTAITNWFVKKRGIALSIKQVLSGFSGVVMVPLVVWLIPIQGWRVTCVMGGVVMLLVGLPLAWFCFKRHRPEYYGLLPDGATVEEGTAETSQIIDRGVEYATEVQEVEFTLRQAMGTPTFWVFTIATVAQGVASPIVMLHGVPFLTDTGIDPLVAAGIYSMMLFVGIPFRLLGGFLADRIRRDHLRFIIGGAYFMQALGFTAFLLNQAIPMIYVWFILFGIGHGLAMIPITAMRARYFGRKAFGSIQGISAMFMTPGGVAAPIYAGWVYDTTGNYITAFRLVAALVGFAAVLALFILPPKPPARITDIRKLV